jgi:hypothetical protein
LSEIGLSTAAPATAAGAAAALAAAAAKPAGLDISLFDGFILWVFTVLDLFVLIMVTCLLAVHLRMIMRNMTTIEVRLVGQIRMGLINSHHQRCIFQSALDFWLKKKYSFIIIMLQYQRHALL